LCHDLTEFLFGNLLALKNIIYFLLSELKSEEKRRLKKVAVLLIVLFFLPIGLIQSTSEITSVASVNSNVIALIPRIVDCFQRQGLQGLADSWAGSLGGSPVLVYDNGVPNYYIVPVLKNNVCIAEIGIDFNSRQWMWYSETYSYASFPPVSVEEAQATANNYLQNKSIEGLMGEPQLSMMPDNCLYWAFPISMQGALQSKVCVSFVSAQKVLLAEDVTQP
jgi:hypothetical protein